MSVCWHLLRSLERASHDGHSCLVARAMPGNALSSRIEAALGLGRRTKVRYSQVEHC